LDDFQLYRQSGIGDMRIRTDVIFFDLFFTLIMPRCEGLPSEGEILGLTHEQWEYYAEDKDLYRARALGREQDPVRMVEAILEKMDMTADQAKIAEIIARREERMRCSICEVDKVIIDVLTEIKSRGYKLCLISNVDDIDIKHYKESRLEALFDEAIFSCEVGYMKPQREIYQIACDAMRITPEHGIFIGDGGSDELRGARDAGMRTILSEHLVEHEPAFRKRVKAYANFVVSDFRDILTILDQI